MIEPGDTLIAGYRSYDVLEVDELAGVVVLLPEGDDRPVRARLELIERKIAAEEWSAPRRERFDWAA